MPHDSDPAFDLGKTRILYLSRGPLDLGICIVQQLLRDRDNVDVIVLASRSRARRFRRAGCKAAYVTGRQLGERAFGGELLARYDPDLLIVHGKIEPAVTEIIGSAAGPGMMPTVLLLEKWPKADDLARTALLQVARLLYFGRSDSPSDRPPPGRDFVQMLSAPLQIQSDRAVDDIVSVVDEQPPLSSFAHRIVVRFDESLAFGPATWRRGLLVTLEELGADSTTLQRFESLMLRPLVTSVSPLRLQALIRRGKQRNPSYKPPNFFSYFIGGVATSFDDAFGLAASLRSHPFVGWAYVDPERASPAYPDPGNVTPGDPNENQYYAIQGHLGAKGINVEAVWPRLGGPCGGGSGFLGADGAGEHLGIVEQDWASNHEDLKDPRPGHQRLTRIYGAHDSSASDEIKHGTRTLGVVCAMDNDAGCIGIVPNIQEVKLAGGGTADFHNAIVKAIDELAANDVLLIEIEANHTHPTNGTVTSRVPVETGEADFLEIEMASANDIVVIEPAGTRSPQPEQLFHRTQRPAVLARHQLW